MNVSVIICKVQSRPECPATRLLLVMVLGNGTCKFCMNLILCCFNNARPIFLNEVAALINFSVNKFLIEFSEMMLSKA